MTNKKSNYHHDSKNLRKSKSGVSEIIGNLLILAITVTMFSGIMYFVINMPSPQGQTISDFSVQTGVSGTDLYVNITHQGGQTLNGSSTNIYLFKNDVPTTLSISSSDPAIGSDWNIGQVWSYTMSGYSSSIEVRVMIVDKTTNNIVWQATLAGVTDQSMPPIIGNRGLMPSPAYDQNNVSFFVTVTALNSKVSTAWVNASSLGIAGNVMLNDADHDGTFSSVSSYKASYSAWNGRTIFFSVTDMAGNTVTGQFIVTVYPNPSGSGGSGGNSTNNVQTPTNGTTPSNATGS